MSGIIQTNASNTYVASNIAQSMAEQIQDRQKRVFTIGNTGSLWTKIQEESHDVGVFQAEKGGVYLQYKDFVVTDILYSISFLIGEQLTKLYDFRETLLDVAGRVTRHVYDIHLQRQGCVVAFVCTYYTLVREALSNVAGRVRRGVCKIRLQCQVFVVALVYACYVRGLMILGLY